LTDLLAERGTGLLLTLDEIHQKQVEELREVATAVQHAFREDRELARACMPVRAVTSRTAAGSFPAAADVTLRFDCLQWQRMCLHGAVTAG
jgi:hypothetical protein